MIGTVCDLTAACVKMSSSLEHHPEPNVDRLEFTVVCAAATLIILIIIKSFGRNP